MSDKPKPKFLQARVEDALHRRAKAEAALTGKSIDEIIETLITLWLEGKIKLEELESDEEE